MPSKLRHSVAGLFALLVTACAADEPEQPAADDAAVGKPVVYQVFTRLFGNKVDTNKAWGTIEENGVGKFNDFTDEALDGIRELGVTHIWYTGIPHHAVIRDYTEYGISIDDPDVVKGRAGSPYAVKDYYNVSPDLAVDPARRLQEFEALIARTHAHDMKVIIDIVPNHVARAYASLSRPEGVEDFGANDDTTVEWARDNNFYYVVGEDFSVPVSPDDYRPLGGEDHQLSDGKFDESPARWTGNGARAAQPDFNDWFETVKMNYGVRPDGSHAFDELPEQARDWTIAEHAEFWANKDVPDSWEKFRDIVLYWTAKGVDGFRYDMAEMVPVEFWSYLNSSIKAVNPDAFILAEVYNPAQYRNYIQLGKMDYLYDKVGLYDTLKPIMQGKESTDAIAPVHAEVLDIEEHMLHFLENHDEQRIASPDFAGDANKAKPAMVVSALLSRSPTMLYFAQDVGEPGNGDAGFGDPTRSSIFDYWGVPSHQRWMNDGAFDGGALTADEAQLRDFYRRLMNFSSSNAALNGDYAEIHEANRAGAGDYDEHLFSFVRRSGDERLIVVSNFSAERSYEVVVTLPASVVAAWQLGDGRYRLDEQLYGTNPGALDVKSGKGRFALSLEPLESVVYRVGDEDATIRRIDIVVQVPEDTNAVYLTGSIPELGPWVPDFLPMRGKGRERRANVMASAGSTFEYKITLGSWSREAVDESDRIFPNFTLDINEDQNVRHDIVAFKKDQAVYMADWQNSGILGTLVYWENVTSEFLPDTRHVEIWLPPGYDENPERRYRVIYMHDGQNLFDPRIANTGTDWGIDEAMMRGVDKGLFEAAIVVGAWSTDARITEYSPWHDAPRYARFLIEEVMPRVNSVFRTRSGAENTFVMGSSMGGLLSYYLVKKYPDVFSACGCVSTSVQLSAADMNQITGNDSTHNDATPFIERDIANGDTVPDDVRLFFDYGTAELDARSAQTYSIVRDWLREQGLVEGRDFAIGAYPGAEHNEASWRARVIDQLTWLLGADRS